MTPSHIEIAGRTFLVTISRDDLGNYSVDAARASDGAPPSLPIVRVVDQDRNRALHALFESLQALLAATPAPAHRSGHPRAAPAAPAASGARPPGPPPARERS